jgi:hypothetical protein
MQPTRISWRLHKKLKSEMKGKLDDSNFFLYAAHHYSNPCVDQQEFIDDLNRIKNLRRLFGRYEKHGELKERLILNHLMVLYNVFEHKALTRMLVFKLYDQLHILKPFLMLLNYWPEIVENIGSDNLTIRSNEVVMDMRVVDVLRKI